MPGSVPVAVRGCNTVGCGLSRQISRRGRRLVTALTGVFAHAQDVVRRASVPVPGESKADARRRAARAFGVSLRVLERLFHGQEGVSPMTALAVVAQEVRVVRADLAQAEAVVSAALRRLMDLRARAEALEAGDAWGTGGGGGCAPGVGSGSACSPSNAAAFGRWGIPSGGAASRSGSSSAANGSRGGDGRHAGPREAR